MQVEVKGKIDKWAAEEKMSFDLSEEIKDYRVTMEELHSEMCKAAIKLAPKPKEPTGLNGEYRIFNVGHDRPLFSGHNPEKKTGDRQLWIGKAKGFDSDKARFILKLKKNGAYNVINKWTGAPVFSSDYKDGAGDHFCKISVYKTYDHAKAQWRIEKQSDGTYKFYNEHHGGPLFSAWAKDSAGDHKLLMQTKRSYDSSRSRWKLEKKA